MKRIAFLLFLTGCLVPLASAQDDHFQAGVYADYFRISQTKSNMAGLGARVAVKALPYVMLEGEMSYDFNQVFTEGFTNPSGGAITFQNSNLKVLHGLFGPKLIGGHHAICMQHPAFSRWQLQKSDVHHSTLGGVGRPTSHAMFGRIKVAF